MATIVAVRSGNWSDTSHVTGPWPGGSTPTAKPGVGDTVQSDAYTVTIDEDVQVALLEATGGGGFVVNAAPTLPAVRTITASVFGGENEGTGALKISNPSGKVVLIGDVTGGVWENAWGIYNNGGTIGDITGDVTGGTMDGSFGIYNNNSGTIGDITGDVTGGSAYNAKAIFNGGTIGDITGNVTGGSEAETVGIDNNGGTIGDITGDVTGGTVSNAAGINNNGTIGDITGDVTGGTAQVKGIYNDGGTIGDITGDVTGGTGFNAWSIYNNGTVGEIDGSLVCGANGEFPIYGSFKMVDNPAYSITVISSLDTPLTLSNDYPVEADVKSGVEYNRGTMTGELAAGSVGPVNIVIGGGGIRIS